MNLPAKTEYQVVVNHEEQYSILPKEKKVPQGWKAIDVSGNRKHCQTYILGVWTDMRPLSLRKRLDR
ncbi:MAG: MbtH family protein [Bacteroidia bacterium]